MFVATTSPAPFGAEIMIHLRLGDAEKEFVLPAIVRWTNAAGMGVQFGSLGARPTLAITEIVRSYQERESAKAPKRAR
jgi:Tfp pilus assembly protein PilZ